MGNELTPPEPGKRLYVEIFEGKSLPAITAVVADGIRVVVSNVDRILSDVDYLRADGRVAPASFLLATADEEFAKIFILVDACRLNPVTHGSTLGSLCRAFYNHIQKHAYNTIRRYNSFIDSMAKASFFWPFEVRRWRPEPLDPEAGEPALPHVTYFDREMPLYVDWDYWGKKWILPDNSMNAEKFKSDYEPSRFELLSTELAAAKVAAASNLLSPDALLVVNEVWSGSYTSDKTPTVDVERLERRLIERLTSELKASEEAVLSSPLLEWPLYHFTTLGMNSGLSADEK